MKNWKTKRVKSTRETIYFNFIADPHLREINFNDFLETKKCLTYRLVEFFLESLLFRYTNIHSSVISRYAIGYFGIFLRSRMRKIHWNEFKSFDWSEVWIAEDNVGMCSCALENVCSISQYERTFSESNFRVSQTANFPNTELACRNGWTQQ